MTAPSLNLLFCWHYTFDLWKNLYMTNKWRIFRARYFLKKKKVFILHIFTYKEEMYIYLVLYTVYLLYRYWRYWIFPFYSLFVCVTIIIFYTLPAAHFIWKFSLAAAVTAAIFPSSHIYVTYNSSNIIVANISQSIYKKKVKKRKKLASIEH